MKRFFAHKIIYGEKEYRMSVTTIEGNRVISIEPFEKEIASTIYISGTIQLIPTEGKIEIIRLPR